MIDDSSTCLFLLKAGTIYRSASDAIVIARCSEPDDYVSASRRLFPSGYEYDLSGRIERGL